MCILSHNLLVGGDTKLVFTFKFFKIVPPCNTMTKSLVLTLTQQQSMCEKLELMFQCHGTKWYCIMCNRFVGLVKVSLFFMSDDNLTRHATLQHKVETIMRLAIRFKEKT